MRSILFVCLDERIELCEKLICIDAVNGTSHFHGFTAGSRAAEAVHTDFKEKGSGLGSDVKDIADDGVSCDFHNFEPNLSVYFLRAGASLNLLKFAAVFPRNNIILS